MHRRLRDREHYLTARRSRLEPPWVWHWSVALRLPSGRIRFVGWKPHDTSPLPWWLVWKAVFARGSVRWGDNPTS